MLRAGAKDLAEPVDHQLHVHRDILAPARTNGRQQRPEVGRYRW
jgi:hypothetical protein